MESKGIIKKLTTISNTKYLSLSKDLLSFLYDNNADLLSEQDLYVLLIFEKDGSLIIKKHNNLEE